MVGGDVDSVGSTANLRSDSHKMSTWEEYGTNLTKLKEEVKVNSIIASSQTSLPIVWPLGVILKAPNFDDSNSYCHTHFPKNKLTLYNLGLCTPNRWPCNKWKADISRNRALPCKVVSS
ncbi:hypothetical protein VNO77_02533 [Canavalia gladiata]|uniref:Uncharacterized protein n=1 Tax=Canavalia gladiata TaxID=3824 RepID=A0AAN9R674_CANGL